MWTHTHTHTHTHIHTHYFWRIHEETVRESCSCAFICGFWKKKSINFSLSFLKIYLLRVNNFISMSKLYIVAQSWACHIQTDMSYTNKMLIINAYTVNILGYSFCGFALLHTNRNQSLHSWWTKSVMIEIVCFILYNSHHPMAVNKTYNNWNQFFLSLLKQSLISWCIIKSALTDIFFSL